MRCIKAVGLTLLGVVLLLYVAAVAAVPVLFVLMWWAAAFEWESFRLIACLLITAFVVAAVGFLIGDDW